MHFKPANFTLIVLLMGLLGYGFEVDFHYIFTILCRKISLVKMDFFIILYSVFLSVNFLIFFKNICCILIRFNTNFIKINQDQILVFFHIF